MKRRLKLTGKQKGKFECHSNKIPPFQRGARGDSVEDINFQLVLFDHSFITLRDNIGLDLFGRINGNPN